MSKHPTGDPREITTLAAVGSVRPMIGTVTDPYVVYQWHLFNFGQTGGRQGIDANVVPAWEDYTGAGVVVGVWDDGIEYTHPDLDDNYDASRHLILRGHEHDPFPASRQSMHGTSVAGVIAAEANGRGTVGVAYDATLVGVDIFYDPDVTDAAFRQLDRFDVTNHSWGYVSAYAANVEDGSWSTFFAGWRHSVETGRDGLGTINVVAAGNSRLANADSNDSGMTNMAQVITVGAVGDNGSVSWYSTPGATLLIAAPSNGPPGAGIWTTDRTGDAGYNKPGNPPPTAAYTDDFGGTSSATPVISGVVALMLEANPGLGWRDVQQILAISARHVGSGIGEEPAREEKHAWAFNGATNWNGGGMHFSNDYGFGLVDARAAVRLAETWRDVQTSDNWQRETGDSWTGRLVVPDDDREGVRLTFDVTSDMVLERIALHLAIEDGFTGDYRIVLVSPDGTRSQLSTPQSAGVSSTESWLYASNAFRGENATGEWTLIVSDRWGADEGTITNARLDLEGAAARDENTWYFTDEMARYSGRFGHSTVIGDRDGGESALNAAAVTTPITIDLNIGTGEIAGVPVKLAGTIVKVATGDAPDLIVGGAADEVLYAGRGNDRLSGRRGDDWLHGGDGRDTLRDGDGRDWLRGGYGDDLIVLMTDGRTDEVAGLHQGADRIQLEDARWWQLTFEDVGRGVIVTSPEDRVLIRGLAADDLTKADFLFV